MKCVSRAPLVRVEAEDTPESKHRHDAPHTHDDVEGGDAQRDEDAPPPGAWS